MSTTSRHPTVAALIYAGDKMQLSSGIMTGSSPTARSASLLPRRKGEGK
uniref:Uncharacterized protein n=1 Tax=Arundo donax TaxID=35708 RepID=A0A0A8XQ65_ARUDO